MVWGYELGFMRFKVQGLRIQGLGVMVQSLRFEDMDQDLGVSGQGLGFYGFKVYGLGISVQGLGFKVYVLGLLCRVYDLGFQGVGFSVYDLGFRVYSCPK